MKQQLIGMILKIYAINSGAQFGGILILRSMVEKGKLNMG